jgi:hypothetical protein
MQKSITVPGIGLVLITKKSNATRLKLRVHPQKGVLVTIPTNVNFNEGERFVLQNLNWLTDKLKSLSEKKDDKMFLPDSIFQTRKLNLRFHPTANPGMKATLRNGDIVILYNPEDTDFEEDAVQEFIKKFILKCLKIEGTDILLKRLSELSLQTGIKFRNASVGTAGTRLGSCSSRNDIILSARLMLLPNDLIDYIILHELSHVIHKNHSEKFHNQLNSLVGGKSSTLNSKLRKKSIAIEPGDFSFSS